MAFHVSLVGRRNLSREIYRQLVRAILEGRLRPGERLTPSRELAEALDVSRMTVNVAYERLTGEGFVTSRQGAGTFVSDVVSRAGQPSAKQRPGGALQPRPIWEASWLPTILSLQQPARFDFRCGLTEGALFPHLAWQRCVTRALISGESASGRYGHPAGVIALRTAIALPRGARAVYVTPSHQFPLGVAMTLRRRQALLAWAERNNAAIFEDDYDSEFRFGGRPLEPLQSIDANGRVIYVGSFSKTMQPGLRLGFLVAPPSLRTALLSAKFLSDWQTPGLLQSALARFMEAGGFARHVRRMTRVYRERRAIILDLIGREFRDHLEPVPSEAGLHVAAFARTATLDQLQQIERSAAEQGVAIQLLWPYPIGPSGRVGMRFGYGAIPTNRIKEGMALLRRCFEDRMPMSIEGDGQRSTEQAPSPRVRKRSAPRPSAVRSRRR